MTLLFRNITIPKWVRPSWMDDADVPADALTDLRATDNVLSFWAIEPDKQNLNVVIAAVTSSRDRLDKLDYLILDEASLLPIPIRCVISEANTPYSSANTSHRDLAELTVRKVATLAHLMMPLQRERLLPKQVKALLLDALANGRLDRARMKPGLLRDLESGAG